MHFSSCHWEETNTPDGSVAGGVRLDKIWVCDPM